MTKLESIDGVVSYRPETWEELADFMLDQLNAGEGNAVCNYLAFKFSTDPYWAQDVINYYIAFAKWPQTELGYFMAHFERGPDWWYLMFKACEADRVGGIKKILQVVAEVQN